jgi:hypothetical protein
MKLRQKQFWCLTIAASLGVAGYSDGEIAAVRERGSKLRRCKEKQHRQHGMDMRPEPNTILLFEMRSTTNGSNVTRKQDLMHGKGM